MNQWAGTTQPEIIPVTDDAPPGHRLDPEIVRRALAGQQDAWEKLFQRYNAHLYRVARSFRLDEATCEDAVQTAWLRLVEHSSTLREPGSVGAWLVTTLRRHIFAVLRSHRQGPELAGPEIDEVADPGHSPEQEVTVSDRDAKLSLALRRLPDRDRELLAVLMDSPSPSYSQVSAEFHLAIGSIGPTRARSLGRLRGELDALGVDRDLVTV